MAWRVDQRLEMSIMDKGYLFAGAERVHRWWSLGDTSAHVQGAQMMGKPSVSFRKARTRQAYLPGADMTAARHLSNSPHAWSDCCEGCDG